MHDRDRTLLLPTRSSFPSDPAPAQDCEILHEVCGWINAKATVPVWAKMTPNITGGQGRGARGGQCTGDAAGRGCA